MARNRNLRNTHTKDTAKNTKDKALTVIDERKVLEKDFKVYGTVEEPLFLAKDVAEWIDYAYKDKEKGTRNVNMMLECVDEDEKTIFLVESGTNNLATTSRARKTQEMWFLTEEGLYEVLFQSRKPIAKDFKKEVKKILKELRTTGGYISNSDKFINTYFDDESEEVKAFMKSALDKIEEKKKRIKVLEAENDALAQNAVEWSDTATINALVRAYGGHIGGDYAEAWRTFKKELLYMHSINLNARITAYLNDTGKKTKPRTLDMLHEEELPLALSTAIAMCRNARVDIDEIISEKLAQ